MSFVLLNFVTQMISFSFNPSKATLIAKNNDTVIIAILLMSFSDGIVLTKTGYDGCLTERVSFLLQGFYNTFYHHYRCFDTRGDPHLQLPVKKLPFILSF